MNFEEIYISSLTTIIVGLVGWFATRLSNYLTDKFDTQKKQKIQKLLKDAREELKECTKDAIIETDQTFVSFLKQDGIFTEEESLIARNKTVERTKELLSAVSLDILESATIPINEAIINQIEIQLPLLKAQGIIKYGGRNSSLFLFW